MKFHESSTIRIFFWPRKDGTVIYHYVGRILLFKNKKKSKGPSWQAAFSQDSWHDDPRCRFAWRWRCCRSLGCPEDPRGFHETKSSISEGTWSTDAGSNSTWKELKKKLVRSNLKRKNNDIIAFMSKLGPNWPNPTPGFLDVVGSHEPWWR